MSDRMIEVRKHLVRIARVLAKQQKAKLDELKAEHAQLSRPDFVWHYLLQSFATMLKASGWHGLIGNNSNYRKVQFDTLTSLPASKRDAQVRKTCKAANLRMPYMKADYILACFGLVTRLGGPEAAKQLLFQQPGRDAKIRFLKTFPGIGDKYARNIMMDVYHEDFRNSIAVDARIKDISKRWGLKFLRYSDHEAFYLSVARDAGLNGWELDRLMFNFRDRFLPTQKM